MDAVDVKEKCTNIIGVIHNFPSSKRKEDIIEEKLEYTNFFCRNPKNLIIEGEHITIPRGHTGVELEVHLGVILNQDVKKIPKEKALDYVEGYVVALNSRIWYRKLLKHKYILRGTEYDFKVDDIAGTTEFKSDVAISAIAHKQLIQNPNDLVIWCSVNDREIQRVPLTEMFLTVEEILEKASKHLDFSKGDIILCGTPSGSERAEADDIVEIGIEKIGRSQFAIEKATEIAPPIEVCPHGGRHLSHDYS